MAGDKYRILAKTKAFFRITSYTAIVFFLFSCADVRRSYFIDMSSINSVGVVSLLGDEFHAVSVNNISLVYRNYVTDVSKWKIDEYVTSVTEDFLREKSGLQVKHIEQDSQLLNSIYSRKNPFIYETKYNLNRVKKDVMEMANLNNVDALLLVLPKFYKTSSSLKGPYGLINYDFYKQRGSYIYSSIMLYLYDVASGRIIGKAKVDPIPAGDDRMMADWSGPYHIFSNKKHKEAELMVKKLLHFGIGKAMDSEGLRINAKSSPHYR